MPKRNVAFIKPDEPAFLQRIKQQIGYREGPTVDTKRQKVQNLDDDSDDEEYVEHDDERPQIVVLKDGDLTEAEAAKAKKEEAEKPADLQQKIVFKSKKPKESSDGAADGRLKESKKVKKAKAREVQSKLSFGDDDEEED